MRGRVIGVVGAGRMGLALARLMRRAGYGFIFYDVDAEALERASASGFGTADSLGDLLSRVDAVMVAVGHRDVAQSLRDVREEIAARAGVRAGLVFDIATFKEGIIDEYRDFPEDVMVASAHPLFGPGARNPRKHRVAVIPVPGRPEGAAELAQVFSSSGFAVSIIDAGRHDEIMSYVIGLTYLVAVASAGALGDGVGAYAEFAGTTFRLLRILMGAVASDAADFITYVISRPGVREVGMRLINSATHALERPGEAVEALKNLFSREEVGELYRRLYECVEGCNDGT